ALMIVIAEYRDAGEFERGRVCGKALRFLRQAEIGQIPAERKDISLFRNLRDKRAIFALIGLVRMQISGRCDSEWLSVFFRLSNHGCQRIQGVQSSPTRSAKPHSSMSIW